ncbi:MAG: serine hydrolase [Betaproteobacteria bacterium]|nr:serine hydrolase [Betaproteobacteria bacterium]
MADVTLYEHFDFQGARQGLDVGRYDLPDLTLSNDVVSSVQVRPGFTVVLYQDSGFSGATRVFTDDVRRLDPAFNDRVSSAIVLGPAVRPEVYRHVDFNGPRREFTVGRFGRSELGVGDNEVSSLRVPPGWTVTLFDRGDFSGTSRKFTADVANLGDFNDKTSSLVVTGPPDSEASALLRDRVHRAYGGRVPGCVFHVTRNGMPYADGSFGWARLPNQTDGALPMSSETLVHVASVGKLICAVAILRLIEEWNAILALSVVDASGRRTFPGLVDPTDRRLVDTVLQSGAPIDLDSAAYPLVEPLLDTALIASFGPNYPGANVASITLRQILSHQSSFSMSYSEADLGGLSKAAVEFEPQGEGQSLINLSKVLTAFLKQDATAAPAYNNAAYTVLGGVVEAVTGRPYTTWTRSRLFPSAQFDDLTRRVIDRSRAARYYSRDGFSFGQGTYHPDYTSFSAAGGWYVSARALCEWLDAVMEKRVFAGRPILHDPERLMTELPGVGGYRLGRLGGFNKNGGTGVGGGATNCRVAFLRGYGRERVCAFVQVNAEADADQVLDLGLDALREHLTRRPVAPPAATGSAGLTQSVYWGDSANTFAASAVVAPVVRTAVSVESVLANRTDLLGNDPLPGGQSRDDIVMVELDGIVQTAGAGPYQFRLSSDDGSLLWIDDRLIIDNDGDHSLRAAESALITLGSRCSIRVRWYNSGGGGALYLEWKLPGAADYTPVPTASFST